MKILIFLYLIAGIYCSSGYDSVKQIVDPINNVGNSFFDNVRGTGEVEEYKNLNLTMNNIFEHAKKHMEFTILLAIGILYIIFLPLSGLFVFICRCCGKCGSQPKAMDPPNARCKRIVYALILFICLLGMMFGAFLIQSNNMITHRSIRSDDTSVNIMFKLKEKSSDMQKELFELRKSINGTVTGTTSITDDERQKMRRSMQNSLSDFLKTLFEEEKFKKLLFNANELIKTFETIPLNKHIESINTNLKKIENLKDRVEQIKKSVIEKLSKSCNDNNCKSFIEEIKKVDVTKEIMESVNQLKAILEFINDPKIKNRISNFINRNVSGSADINLIMDQEIKNIEKTIESPEFNTQIRNHVENLIGQIENVLKIVTNEIPTPYVYDPTIPSNNADSKSRYKDVLKYENIRFFVVIAIFVSVLLLIVLYIVGLLFGIIGNRPGQDACCSRSIGAGFIMVAVAISFMLGPILMALVVSFMISLGSAQTEFCQYTRVDSTIGPQVLDSYLKLILTMANVSTDSVGVMQGLLRNCEKEKLYPAFGEIIKPILKRKIHERLQSSSTELEKSIRQTIENLGLNNTSGFNDFKDSTLFDKLVDGIDKKFQSLLTEMKKHTQIAQETQQMEDIYKEFKTLPSIFKNIIMDLTKLPPVFETWTNSLNDVLKELKPILNRNANQLYIKLIDSIVPIIDTLLTHIFKNVPCSKLRTSTMGLLVVFCDDTLTYMNGSWYGLGLLLILLIPVIIFGLLLDNLYRRLQSYYPEKPEPDYDHYIGFYARGDVQAINSESKKRNKGYQPIPLTSVS